MTSFVKKLRPFNLRNITQLTIKRRTDTHEHLQKRKVNDGEVNSYAAEGNNEPIIPEEMFYRVQEERTRRSNVEVGEDGVKYRKSTKYSAKKKE